MSQTVVSHRGEALRGRGLAALGCSSFPICPPPPPRVTKPGTSFLWRGQKPHFFPASPVHLPLPVSGLELLEMKDRYGNICSNVDLPEAVSYLPGGKEKGCREKRKASINFSNYHPAMVIIVNHVPGSIHEGWHHARGFVYTNDLFKTWNNLVK